MKTYTSLLVVAFFIFFQNSCIKNDLIDDLEVPGDEYNCNILEHWVLSEIQFPINQAQLDLFFVSNDVGYSVGNNGTICKTLDGGINWEVLEYYSNLDGINPEAITRAKLEATHFIDDQIGYVGGEGDISLLQNLNTDAVFLKTLNGGKDWDKSFIDGVREIEDLLFLNQDVGYGLFYFREGDFKRKLVKTNNRGDSWEVVHLPEFKLEPQEIFIEGSTIILMATDGIEENGYLLKSYNLGQDWEVINMGATYCNRLIFINENFGIASCGLLFFPEYAMETRDGGYTWQQIESPVNVSSMVHFSSIDNGLVINRVIEYVEGGGELSPNLVAYEAFETKDSGASWQKTTLDRECSLEGTTFAPQNDLFYSLGIKSYIFREK